MATPIKVVGLGGSLSTHSSSLKALVKALDGAREVGADVELLDVAALDLPMYVPGSDISYSASARHLCDTVASADGLIWSSPLYHGTISGAFKNALDWLELLGNRQPAYLTDKVVGLISTAGGVQGLQAINTMEYVVRALRGWTVPLVVPVARAWQAFDDDGNARDPRQGEQLWALGREVARTAALFRTNPALTTEDAQRAEATIQPISAGEAALVG